MGVTGERETGEALAATRVLGVLITEVPEDKDDRAEILRSGRASEYDFYRLDLAGLDLTLPTTA